jgi:transcriptional regulator with XRE-family HTH domain
MARGARLKPNRLAEKLVQIRTMLELSQNGMIERLGVELTQNRISEYETGKGEPPLIVLLRYARVAGVYMEEIIDDELDLPAKLPSKTTYCRKLN